MGYQNIDTSDITITENAAGALLDGNTVKLAIDSLYGSKELGFADADNLTLTTDGNLEAKNFKVSDGEMSSRLILLLTALHLQLRLQVFRLVQLVQYLTVHTT